jgi:hypothetical protein
MAIVNITTQNDAGFYHRRAQRARLARPPQA